MKGFITFIKMLVIAMLVSCSINSLAMELGLAPKMAAAPVGVSVGAPGPTSTNPNRKDFMYGDFNMSDNAPRTVSGYATKAVNDNSENQVEFPSSW